MNRHKRDTRSGTESNCVFCKRCLHVCLLHERLLLKRLLRECSLKNLLIPTILTGMLFSSLPIAVAADQLTSSDTVASINFSRGDAHVDPNGISELRIPAHRGMAIAIGDAISTGEDGFVSLLFVDESVVNLQPSSELIVTQVECNGDLGCKIELHAERGTFQTSVEKRLDQGNAFNISTPYATAAVRGTVFDVDVSSGSMTTGVTKGNVDVASPLGLVNVPENFGSKVLPDEPPSAPIALLSAPELLPGAARFDQGGVLSWQQLADASEYLVSVNQNNNAVYQTRSTEQEHLLEPLDLGSYVLMLRAIDENGLKGQSSSRAFDIVTVNGDAQGPAVNSVLQDEEFMVFVGKSDTDATLVELQLSTNAAFEPLISIDMPTGQPISADRVDNIIYVRARSVLSNTEVSEYGPTLRIPVR